MAMFEYDINTAIQGSARQGEEAYRAWLLTMKIDFNSFPFKVKTGKLSKGGREINMNVASWGFYQASDWQYYIFISYQSSDRKCTMAYHWSVDKDGMPSGTPRLYQWTN